MTYPVGTRLVRVAFAVGALSVTMPVATAFAWTQPICNSSTGAVLQPSQFPNESAYNQFVQQHPGSFVMQSGQTCQAPAAQPQTVAAATTLSPAPATSSPAPATSSPAPATSSPAPPPSSPGTFVCVVTETDTGRTVEQRRVTDMARFMAAHPGSFIMPAGKNCGPTFTPRATVTKSAPKGAIASAPAMAPSASPAPAALTVPVVAAPAGVPTETASAASTTPEVQVAGIHIEAPAPPPAELSGELDVLAIPPAAGDGSTADELVP